MVNMVNCLSIIKERKVYKMEYTFFNDKDGDFKHIMFN